MARDWSETTPRYETDPIAKHKYDATAEVDRLVVERLAEVAQKRGVPRAQIALAWFLHKKPVVAPVIGAIKVSHVETAVEAASIQLSAEEIAYMEEPYLPHPIVGHS